MHQATQNAKKKQHYIYSSMITIMNALCSTIQHVFSEFSLTGAYFRGSRTLFFHLYLRTHVNMN